MRNTIFKLACLVLLAVIISSCYSQRKTGCEPSKGRREVRFKGFL